MRGPTDADAGTSVETYGGIVAALGPYLAAARHGTVDGLRDSWHERARIVGWVAQNGPSPGLAHHIVSIDVSGPAAAVRVEFSGWLGLRFTDFFLMRRTEVRWEIVSKVYDTHGRTGRPRAGQAPRAGAADHAGLAAIRGVIDAYVEGARTGDGGRLRAIWFDHARITGWRDGALVDLDADAFCRRVAEAGGAPAVEAQVVSIDRSGVAASARVELRDWNGVRFTDFLTLMEGPDGWRVSGEVFDAHDRA